VGGRGGSRVRACTSSHVRGCDREATRVYRPPCLRKLTQQELEELDAELLLRREGLSVIGPLPAGAPGSDAATDLPQIAEEEIPVSPGDQLDL
jgi:hypothetical protein